MAHGSARASQAADELATRLLACARATGRPPQAHCADTVPRSLRLTRPVRCAAMPPKLAVNTRGLRNWAGVWMLLQCLNRPATRPVRFSGERWETSPSPVSAIPGAPSSVGPAGKVWASTDREPCLATGTRQRPTSAVLSAVWRPSGRPHGARFGGEQGSGRCIPGTNRRWLSLDRMPSVPTGRMGAWGPTTEPAGCFFSRPCSQGVSGRKRRAQWSARSHTGPCGPTTLPWEG